MIIKLKIGNTKLTFSASKMEDVVGVNSMIGDKDHILMWDFDYTDQAKIIKALKITQWTFKLPAIYVLKTAEKKGFHAYCFKRNSLQEACEILSTTDYIDMNYFRMGAFRGYWTLRLSKKSGRSFELCEVLKSVIKEDVELKELKQFTLYDTLPDGASKRTITIGRQQN